MRMSKMSLSLFLGLVIALYFSFLPTRIENLDPWPGAEGDATIEYIGIPFSTSIIKAYYIKFQMDHVDSILRLKTQEFIPLALMFDWLIFAGLIRFVIFGHEKINTKEKQYRFVARLLVCVAIVEVFLMLLLPIILFLRFGIGLFFLLFVFMSFDFEQGANRLKERREVAEMRRKK